MENISNVESEIFHHFMKNINSSWIRWLQQVSKKLGQAHVYHCVASPLHLQAVCKCLATEETSCWTFGRGMSSHSCPIYSSICSAVLFSVDSMWFYIVLPWKSYLDGSILRYLSALIKSFKMLKVFSFIGTNAPAFELSAVNWPSWLKRRRTLSKTRHPLFPKIISNFHLSRHRKVFHFASAHCEWCPDSSVFGSCSHMLSYLHDRALTCICGWHDELCSLTVISGSLPEPMHWFPWQKHGCV